MGAGRVGQPPSGVTPPEGPLPDERLEAGPSRNVRGVVAEIGLSLLLVLGCFVVFTVILSASFPGGARLSDVLGDSGPRETVLADSTALAEAPAVPTIVARVSSIERNVKAKTASSVAWGAARVGQTLADRDAVQTLARSTANLSFGSRGNLDVGENSLVVVRLPRAGETEFTPRARLMAIDGELRGRISEPGAGGVGVEIGDAFGAAVVPVKGSGSAEIKVVAGDQGRSTFMVYDGEVQVTSKRGAKRLPANHYMTIDSTGALGPALPLPPAPRLVAPNDGETAQVRRTRGELRFRWDPVEVATRYHFVVARDAKFREVVYEGRLDEAAFAHTRIAPGTYHWRVSTLAGVVEGPWSRPWRASVVPDRDGPSLAVEFPKEPVRADRWMVEGTTEPGCTVRVAGELVPVDAEGRFRGEVRLEPGVNVVVVQAIDAAGNVVYASEHVTARY